MTEFNKSLTGFPKHRSPDYGGSYDGIRAYLDTLPSGGDVLNGLMTIEDALLRAAPQLPFERGVLALAGTIGGVLSYVSDSTMEAHAAQLVVVDYLGNHAKELEMMPEWELPLTFVSDMIGMILFAGEFDSNEAVAYARIMQSAGKPAHQFPIH